MTRGIYCTLTASWQCRGEHLFCIFCGQDVVDERVVAVDWLINRLKSRVVGADEAAFFLLQPCPSRPDLGQINISLSSH